MLIVEAKNPCRKPQKANIIWMNVIAELIEADTKCTFQSLSFKCQPEYSVRFHHKDRTLSYSQKMNRIWI